MTDELWPLVVEQARVRPEAVLAVDEAGRSITFGELRHRGERTAAALYGLGAGPASRVSWQLPIGLESLVVAAALARLCAVQNPLLTLYRDREIGYIVGQFEPALYICPTEWNGYDFYALAERCGAAHILPCDRDLPEADAAALPPYGDLVEAAGDDLRWVIYTSGTTADPKGAMHTDASLATPSRSMVARMALTERDVVPVLFPYAHVGGLTMMFSQLMTGASAVLAERYDGDRTIEWLGGFGITIAAGGTTLVQNFLDHQRRHPERRLFPELRFGLAGAAPKPPLLQREVRETLGGIGILSAYGLTEVPLVSMSPLDSTEDELATTEGRATDGCELRVVADGGRICTPGEEGELRVRGANVFRGYLDSSLDAEAFDADGFFRTGDLVTIDERGNLVITGRTKDIIIRKGENISAKRVEDLLYEHPKIAQVSVIGLPDPAMGERCCAVVVPADPADPVSFAEMADYCVARGLARHMVPEQLELADELPRTAMGKVRKRELQDHYIRD